jgi:nucleoside-diphosphate-sugar epimerase
VREAVRCAPTTDARREIVNVGEINGRTDWQRAIEGVNGVIHLAGRAHILREDQTDPFAAYRCVNMEGTLRLAQQAAAAGVRRLVFVSSIVVNGSRTAGRPFTELDTPHPHNPYSMTKHMAEVELRRIGQETGMEIVLVRPPLVYGPGAKGNFLTLLRWVHRGLPLPLGRCDNRRSLIGLENLVDLLWRCATDPRAAGQTFLAGDGEDLSTPDLICRLANALGVKPRLLPVPVSWLLLAARVARRPNDYERLCGSLQVDISHAQQVLGWTPPSSIEEELARTARWFEKESGRA